ncbi:MAG TPA: mechanosensitive ion channel domain-containing protein [Micromonosporaceae bacterium]|nr:mechanosensitive ion channel domain-containing protein [Micromonosporaceae bacterium]
MLTVFTDVGLVAVVVLAALVVAWVIGRVIGRGGNRVLLLAQLSARTRVPFRFFAVMVALLISLHAVEAPARWWGILVHAVALVTIGAGAWLVTGLLFVIQENALTHYRTDVSDNRRARAVHTQVTVVRRFTAAVVALIAVGAMLMTFHTVRLIGTSLLASAGVTAAIAAFALNTMLGNVIAGLQLAFGGSLRLEDVVVINGEWGRVEEITLTYVVVQLWDDRRLILPTSYLTTRPFENWTRSESSLLGDVTLEVDWTVPLDRMRERLREILSGTSLWDGRVSVVQAVDAAQGRVTVRALVSAPDAPTLWDLRCVVREALIAWVRDNDALPRVRTDVSPDGQVTAVPRQAVEEARRDGARPAVAGDDRVFSGDRESRERGESFSGPDQD